MTDKYYAMLMFVNVGDESYTVVEITKEEFDKLDELRENNVNEVVDAGAIEEEMLDKLIERDSLPNLIKVISY